MKFLIEGEIRKDLVYDLINFYNEEPEAPVIYITGIGGDVDSAEAMIDLINRYPATELIAYGELHSSTLRIFLLAKVKKTILPNAVGIHHQTTITIPLNDLKKPRTHYDRIVYENSFKGFQERVTELNNILELSKKELKDFNSGLDIYISTDRLKQIAEKTKKNV